MECAGENERCAFLAISDWGEYSDVLTLLAKSMSDFAEVFHPNLILSAGDNFYPDGVTVLFRIAFHLIVF
jgi:hypothetical protein